LGIICWERLRRRIDVEGLGSVQQGSIATELLRTRETGMWRDSKVACSALARQVLKKNVIIVENVLVVCVEVELEANGRGEVGGLMAVRLGQDELGAQ
jgi:hypothetical protein